MSHEVYRVERVVGTSADGAKVEFQPFYEVKHTRALERRSTFWHSVRRPAVGSSRDNDQGTEVYLSLVDLDFRPSVPAAWTLQVEYDVRQPRSSRAAEGQRFAPAAGDVVVGPRRHPLPDAADLHQRPDLGQGMRLAADLAPGALNYLSLVEGPDGPDALRELIGLYDVKNDPGSRMLIDGLTGARAERVVGRVVDRVDRRDSTFICRGLEVTLDLDEDKFTDGSTLVFAAVLERFLGLYCSINSFVKTIARTKQREGIFYEWKRRAGNQSLL